MDRFSVADAFVVALVVVAAALSFVLSGCATYRLDCHYGDDGQLVRTEVKSQILGTGETEYIGIGCAAASYSTKGTGLSENGRKAITGLAEAAARGAVQGLLGGAPASSAEVADVVRMIAAPVCDPVQGPAPAPLVEEEP